MKKFLTIILLSILITSCKNIEKPSSNPEIPLSIQLIADSTAVSCRDTLSKFVPLFLLDKGGDYEYLFNISNKKSEFIQKTQTTNISFPILILLVLIFILAIIFSCIN